MSPIIRFPETARKEWQVVADAANADAELRKRIERDTLVERELERLRIRHEATTALQQEIDAEDTPALEMTTLSEYQQNPSAAPRDAIEGVLKENGLCVVLGPSGSGKSTLAFQMANSLMTGDDWLGQPTTQISGGVGVLSYDMDASMVMDWMAGFPKIDGSKVRVVNAYKRGHPLGVPAIRSQIVASWKAAQTEVVVLDSFSASFHGHDQNDAAATMAHYRDLKKFALTEVGAKILIVIAHSTDGSPKKVRGSSVHKDTADTMVVVVADPDTGSRTVSVEKYRQIRGGPQEMTPVIVTAPDSATHLVSLDPGAMSLAGLPIPPSVLAAAAFPALPDPHEAPEIDSTSEQEDEQ